MVESINKVETSRISGSKITILENKLQAIEDEQGIFGKIWNGTKELTSLGTSQKDCQSMLKQFKQGKISFEEAAQYLNSFEQKQENMTELTKNIATGIGAIAFATVTAGTGLGLVAAAQAGAPIGAGIKAALGLVDRMTNNVKDDALDTKEIIKDAVSGAVTGTTSAVSSGIMKGIESSSIATSVKNGMKCGAMCGAIAGSTSYITDVALEKDKKFNFGELTTATATSSAISSLVGGTIGAGMYANSSTIENMGVIVRDSVASTLRKIFNNGVRDVGSSLA